MRRRVWLTGLLAALVVVGGAGTAFRWLLGQTPSAGGPRYPFRYGEGNFVPVVWS